MSLQTPQSMENNSGLGSALTGLTDPTYGLTIEILVKLFTKNLRHNHSTIFIITDYFRSVGLRYTGYAFVSFWVSTAFQMFLNVYLNIFLFSSNLSLVSTELLLLQSC